MALEGGGSHRNPACGIFKSLKDLPLQSCVFYLFSSQHQCAPILGPHAKVESDSGTSLHDFANPPLRRALCHLTIDFSSGGAIDGELEA